MALFFIAFPLFFILSDVIGTPCSRMFSTQAQLTGFKFKFKVKRK